MLWLLLCGLAAPVPALAQPAPTAAQAKPDPAAKTAAVRLARMIYSEESQLGLATRVADTEMAPAFRKNMDFVELETRHPGFIDALIKELKPALARFTLASLPAYYDRIADLIASRLTAGEIDDLAGFYASPTGRKLVQGVHDNLSVTATLTEAVTEPDKPTSYGAIAADHKAAADAATRLIDKSDEPALAELAKKPYFVRLAALGPAMRKLEQDFMNEPAPEFEAEVEQIVKATYARFEAAEKK